MSASSETLEDIVLRAATAVGYTYREGYGPIEELLAQHEERGAALDEAVALLQDALAAPNASAWVRKAETFLREFQQVGG